MLKRTVVDCVVCGGAMCPYRRDWLKRCDACGLLASSFPVAIPEEAGGAVLDEELRDIGLAALRARNNARLLDAIGQHVRAPGRLLDVGCGPGFLLAQAEDRGYRVTGVEPDPNVLSIARLRGPVRHGFFPAALTPDDRFDVIVFNDVLEHIPDLQGALSAAAHHLLPRGLLVLNCPDRRGLFFKAAAAMDRLGLSSPYERLWQRGLPSPHVWYFTPGNLARAASDHGMQSVGEVVLDTIDLGGLWQRISCVRGQSLPMSLAAYAFSVAAAPLSKVAPDAVACLFRPASARYDSRPRGSTSASDLRSVQA